MLCLARSLTAASLPAIRSRLFVSWPDCRRVPTPGAPVVKGLSRNEGKLSSTVLREGRAGNCPPPLGVASGWPYNPPGSFFVSVDTQPAHGNRGFQGMDPDSRLPPTNISGHFLRKAPFCWALSKRHSGLTPFVVVGAQHGNNRGATSESHHSLSL